MAAPARADRSPPARLRPSLRGLQHRSDLQQPLRLHPPAPVRERGHGRCVFRRRRTGRAALDPPDGDRVRPLPSGCLARPRRPGSRVGGDGDDAALERAPDGVRSSRARALRWAAHPDRVRRRVRGGGDTAAHPARRDRRLLVPAGAQQPAARPRAPPAADPDDSLRVCDQPDAQHRAHPSLRDERCRGLVGGLLQRDGDPLHRHRAADRAGTGPPGVAPVPARRPRGHAATSRPGGSA